MAKFVLVQGHYDFEGILRITYSGPMDSAALDFALLQIAELDAIGDGPAIVHIRPLSLDAELTIPRPGATLNGAPVRNLQEAFNRAFSGILQYAAAPSGRRLRQA